MFLTCRGCSTLQGHLDHMEPPPPPGPPPGHRSALDRPTVGSLEEWVPRDYRGTPAEYRGTSPIRKCPPPLDSPKNLGIGLR